jgi:hypothetical protein
MGYAFVKQIYDSMQKSAKTGGMDAKTAEIVLTIPPPQKPEGMGAVTGAVFTIVASTILTPFVGVPLASAMSSAAVTAANGGDVKQIATNAMTSYVATNPGLSTTQKIVASSSIQLATGAKPEDIIRNVAATVAAAQIPEVLKGINEEVAKSAPNLVQDTVKSAMVNAERQAVAAAINGQNVAQNALAGAIGGTVADVGLLATDNQAIARSVGEYAQYKQAGYSDDQALAKSIQGYASESAKAEAAKKIKQQTAGLSVEQVMAAQNYGGVQQDGGLQRLPPVSVTANAEKPVGENLSVLSAPETPGARRLSATDTRSLPPITVTANTDKSLPGVSVTGTVGEDLSIITPDTTEKQPEEKTPEQQRRDIILTSLINKRVDTPLYNNKRPVAQQSGPGTAALAQALRVGDVGAPIFGRDEEGKKAGWNLESLRYMGDVGA